MRTFYHLLGEALHRGPPELLERLSPWIILLLSTAIAAIMLYAWWPY
jgi:hypothetical protein